MDTGEILGVLGPNGAGKTTTIRLLLGQLHPSSGHGQVLGLDLRERSLQIRHQIGYLPGDLSLYPKVPGRPGPSRVPTLNRLTAPAVRVAAPRIRRRTMPAREMAVEVEGLTKSFGSVHALRGLDLTVPTGQVTGFLGPNGSGKSTTIRILLGLLRSDGGRASVLEGDPWVDAVRLHRSIAYVPGDVALWPNLTGGEAIDILSRLSGSLDPARRRMMLDRFELDPTKKARTYSKGNRQKVALVAALASDAELLLLDEPTSGLDPIMEAAFTDSILEVKAAGRSVLLSSHIFAEVEKLADRVTIIRDGVTVEAGTIAQLRHLTRSQVTIAVDAGADGLAALPGVHDLQVLDGHVTFAVDDAELPTVLTAVARLRPRSIVANPPSLEELFLRHYGDELAAVNGVDR